jgi:hypothetical protein
LWQQATSFISISRIRKTSNASKMKPPLSKNLSTASFQKTVPHNIEDGDRIVVSGAIVAGDTRMNGMTDADTTDHTLRIVNTGARNAVRDGTVVDPQSPR